MYVLCLQIMLKKKKKLGDVKQNQCTILIERFQSIKCIRIVLEDLKSLKAYGMLKTMVKANLIQITGYVLDKIIFTTTEFIYAVIEASRF